MRLKKLAGACADMDMPAVAVTDKNNLFAALEFSIYAADAGCNPLSDVNSTLPSKIPLHQINQHRWRRLCCWHKAKLGMKT